MVTTTTPRTIDRVRAMLRERYTPSQIATELQTTLKRAQALVAEVRRQTRSQVKR